MELAHVLDGRRLEVRHRPDRRMLVWVGRERDVVDDFREPAVGLILDAHPPLFLDDLAFPAEGRIVDASADSEADFLIETLDTDEGARRIGELGIGCNPGIDRYMRNVYFDEKMNGTIHLALGYGFDDIGGTNVSAIHWDIVKDLRSGGRIELDGKVG